MAATHNAEKEGGGMKSSTFISALFALALAACATQEPPKPAPPPEPKPAPAPAPAPTPAPIQEVKPAPKPEPKKPAVVNLASIELFEFNKATLTDEAKKKLDAEVVAKLKDFGQIRYINVNGHADRLGSAQYNQRLSARRALPADRASRARPHPRTRQRAYACRDDADARPRRRPAPHALARGACLACGEASRLGRLRARRHAPRLRRDAARRHHLLQ